MKFNLTVTVIVVLYLLVMLFIGWYSSKKITSIPTSWWPDAVWAPS